MADLEKKILEAPKLPNHIQGDGRYLMSLLKSFLEQTATQVNLANGFSAEEINPEAGGYPTPRDFFLSFTRLGGEFTWTHLYDVSELAYYELRTDRNVGSNSGLLERTLENHSAVLPINYADTVYLYAVSTKGAASSPAVINYSKPRPDAPQDITVTKTSEGTLITFLEIPSNCIGANIYIGGRKYQSVDNIYLLVDNIEIESVEVAYYDQFGEGERGVLYLALPDVTGFLVERNGSDLDFYWDAINIYGVKYLVKVGATPSWEEAVELFRTTTNDKNRRIYPNTGKYYLLVKAYDENGNYSKNAVYQVMNNEPDIHRNIILELDQSKVLYNGNKINVYYDLGIDGVVLDRDAIKGEYIFSVSLPQKYRARNWIDYQAVSVTSSSLTWDDADFSWDEAEQRWAGVIGNVDNANFVCEIALKNTEMVSGVFSADLNGSTVSDQGATPFEEQNTDDFRSGRWAQGLYVDLLTRLAYSTGLTTESFSLIFFLKTTSKLTDAVLVIMSNDDKEYLLLGYDARLNHFYLTGSDGNTAFVPCRPSNSIEYYTFGVTQDGDTRSLYVNVYSEDMTLTGTVDATPVGVLDKLYCYPNLSIIN